MLRGGGVCIEGPTGSLQKVSPRIRALQDRLLDSLPADGAWECLSPAQREAIISLHRARLTRNIVSLHEPSPNRNKRQNRKNDKCIKKGLNRYGRSRSYEDKLESETDDSGVRVASAGTNSSNTSNSHEDDSSDPGVKKTAGRFAKSPSADRLICRKENKVGNDISKKKGVTNGIGNVNKIISKQLNRTGQQHSNNITLDVRTTQNESSRIRINSENSVFKTQQQQLSEISQQRMANKEKKIPSREGISRKNILQRYQDPVPAITKDKKESVSSEDNDSGVNFRYQKDDINIFRNSKSRRPHSGIDNGLDFDIGRYNISDINPSPHMPNRIAKYQHSYQVQSTVVTEHISKKSDFSHVNNNIHEGCNNLEPALSKGNSKSDNATKLNSKFDYRNHLNQDWVNKYSSNWNSIILSRTIPIKNHNIPPAKVSPRNNKLCKGSAMVHGKSTGNLAYDEEMHRQLTGPMHKTHDSRNVVSGYQEKNQIKKYVRSKSLDRKYLDDSSEDESDFEIRRRTERMRRYAKANQEWESRRTVESKTDITRQNNFRNDPCKSKSKSVWDVSKENDGKPLLEGEKDNVFRSRKNILNRWKSEESDLVLNSQSLELRNYNDRKLENRWRRRSCDFELDAPVTEYKGQDIHAFEEFSRRQWQRRSCDFDLDFDPIDTPEKRHFPDSDWDQSVDNEMELLRQRKKASPKEELRRMYRNPALPKERPVVETRHNPPIKPVNDSDGELLDTDGIAIVHPNKYQIRPEICGRKWPRLEDHHSAVPNRLPVVQREKEKQKAGLDFRSKFRLFKKSILSF